MNTKNTFTLRDSSYGTKKSFTISIPSDKLYFNGEPNLIWSKNNIKNKLMEYLCRNMTGREPVEHMEEDDELLAGNWCGFRPPAAVASEGAAAAAAPAAPAATDTALPAVADEEAPTGPPRIASSPTGNVENISLDTSIGSSQQRGDDTYGSKYASNMVPGRRTTTMGVNYHQCKEARNAANCLPTMDYSPGISCSTVVNEQHERIGNLDFADGWLNSTFRGSRVSSGDTVVNQNISLSFDPLTMVCITCPTQHSIMPTTGSGLVIAIADQNFVSAVPGTEACIPVVRLEDASLDELFQFTREVFGRTPIPAGSLFLVGSASHLHKVGSTIYALEWQKCVSSFTGRWPMAQVGPLPPAIREEVPGSFLKVIAEIRYWFDRIYGNNIVFPRAAWDTLMRQVSCCTDNTMITGIRDRHSVALPLTLHDTTLYPQKVVTSSCLLSMPGHEDTDELVLSLVGTLHCKFGILANPGDILLREPAGSEAAKETTDTPDTILILGASHARHLATALRDKGLNVIDLSVPGWTPTAANVEKLVEEIRKVGNTTRMVAVCDMISNVSFRYEDGEGSSSVPFKSAGTYHMGGKVVLSNKEVLHTNLMRALAALKLVKGLKVILPPLPRYLVTPCCEDPDHCTGREDSDYSTDLLSATLSVKKTVKEFVVDHGLQNAWVPDIVRKMWPEDVTTKSLTDRLVRVTAGDGVHLTNDGYSLMGETILSIISEKKSSAALVSGPSASQRFYWRGFESPVGSTREKPSVAFYKESHPGGGKWRNREMRQNAYSNNKHGAHCRR